MRGFFEKVKIVITLVKDIKNIFFFRDFFIYYLRKIPELKNLPQNKKYLTTIHDVVGGYCAKQFLLYAPVFMEPYITANARQIFTDADSQALYRTVFLRIIYASHFIAGWETYYDTEEVYFKKLSQIRASIEGEVDFNSNFFISKEKKDGGFLLRFKNGSAYVLPINWFEISVFSLQLGLPSLDEKYRAYIKGRNIIDVGAFVGDSSIVLAGYTEKKVIAIEPQEKNYKSLQRTLVLNGMQGNIDAYNVALDKEERTVGIQDHGPGSSIIGSSEGSHMTTVTLNKLIAGKYHDIGLIKMDVEGYEMNILLGCEDIIKNHKPVLLISIYHSGEQFINIPLYFKEKFSHIYDFKFIDCNPVSPMSEKVFVCLPKDI